MIHPCLVFDFAPLIVYRLCLVWVKYYYVKQLFQINWLSWQLSHRLVTTYEYIYFSQKPYQLSYHISSSNKGLTSFFGLLILVRSDHPFRCGIRYLNSVHWYITLQISEFIQLGKEELVPFYAKIVGVILDSISDNDDVIRKVNP